MKQTADASEALAYGFAQHLGAMAQGAGCSEPQRILLEDAAFATSMAASSGHVCLHLASLSEKHGSDYPALKAALQASGMVSSISAADRPLVLDDDHRLYLNRYFDYERRLAKRLLEPYQGTHQAIDARLQACFEAVFQGNQALLDGQIDWQRIAAALAVNQAFTVISGGPGTGKTTSILQLIRCAKHDNPTCRIQLAAPTGKAAARMLEALRLAANRSGVAHRIELPTESFTIHRLLGATSQADRFRHDRENPLAVDLLIIDEASMLDLALAVHLVEAVPNSARIVFLGDKDQLAAVEAGAVFAELSANPLLSAACINRLSMITPVAAAALQAIRTDAQGLAETPLTDTAQGLAETPPTDTAQGLSDRVVWLRHNFRFSKQSAIDLLVAQLKRGDADAALDLLQSGNHDDLVWIKDDAPHLGQQAWRAVLEGMQAYINQAAEPGDDPAALFDALSRYRVLCAEREGPRGVKAINQALGQALDQALGQASAYARGLNLAEAVAQAIRPGFNPGGAVWQANWRRDLASRRNKGQALMVLQNDNVLGRFNGDIGILIPDPRGRPVVYFPHSEGGHEGIALSRLPVHEPAFALTVHKAQGSEFDRISLILPAKRSPVLNQALIYTAISRAKRAVTIIAGESVLREAISTATRRYSGLRSRFAELMREEAQSHPTSLPAS